VVGSEVISVVWPSCSAQPRAGQPDNAIPVIGCQTSFMDGLFWAACGYVDCRRLLLEFEGRLPQSIGGWITWDQSCQSRGRCGTLAQLSRRGR